MSQPLSDHDAINTVSAWKRRRAELAAALTFYTRLPPIGLGKAGHGSPDFDRISWVVPVIGAIVGAIGGLVLWLAVQLGLNPLPAALLAVAAMVMATGAFHEDGLADTADSLGGYTREKRLEIMRDSRIGTFGACALILAIGLRAALIAALIRETGMAGAALILIAAEAVSRAGALLLAAMLPPARSDGAGSAFAARQGAPATLNQALLIAALIAFLTAASAAGVMPTVLALIASGLAVVAMAAFARRNFGGQTGDVAGATQQIAMLSFLVAVAMLH